jgi:DNA polymerase-3 subunit epsilon
VGFLDHELGLLDMPGIRHACCGIVDTLRMAKDLRPGQRNNLDALCRHYGIDNSSRTLHGALLDAELLADVYLAMTRGQESLMMDIAEQKQDEGNSSGSVRAGSLLVLPASGDELEAHRAYLAGLDKAAGGICMWNQPVA